MILSLIAGWLIGDMVWECAKHNERTAWLGFAGVCWIMWSPAFLS